MIGDITALPEVFGKVPVVSETLMIKAIVGINISICSFINLVGITSRVLDLVAEALMSL